MVADQEIASRGATTITGNVAVAATTDLSGFPPGVIVGETHLADQAAIDAAGATTALNQNLIGQPCNSDRSGQDLGGLRLGGAVYCYIEPAVFTGELRLDALGDIDTVWVFQMRGGLDVAPGSRVVLSNGAQGCNVFWQVIGDVSIGAGAAMIGTVVTDASVELGRGATHVGRLFAPQGTVQLTANTISQSACATGANQTTTTTAAGSSPTATTVAPTTSSTAPPSADSNTTDGRNPIRARSGSQRIVTDLRSLPRTGSSMAPVALAAFALLGMGGALVRIEHVLHARSLVQLRRARARRAPRRPLPHCRAL